MKLTNPAIKSKQAFTIAPLSMSWDIPIEDEILQYVRHMKHRWQNHRSIWGSVNKAATIYASAYESVEKHILREIEIRKEIEEE